MGKHRIDTPDTLDPAIHLIAKLQAEGWGLDELTLGHTYTDTEHRAPISAVITIRLLPSRQSHTNG